MRPIRLALFLLAPMLMSLATPASAGLEESRENYRASLARIEQDHKVQLAAMPDSYLRAVAAVGKQAQTSGQLELLIGARAEHDRFMAEKSIPTAATADTPDEILSARDRYRTAMAELDVARSRRVVELTKQYLAHLGSEKQRLTVEGQIDDALAVKQESERVVATDLYRSAQFVLADAQTRSGTPDEPDAPAPTPATPDGRADTYEIRWDGSRGQNATVSAGPQRSRSATLTHQGGNRVDRRAIECVGGRSLLDDVGAELLQACKETNELTLGAIVEPANLTQTGPARILSFSLDGLSRNFSLCQERDQLVLRLRTTETGNNGTYPEVRLGEVKEGAQLGIVVTYRPGEMRCYINGRETTVRQIQGDFSNWADGHQLVAGNEWKDERPWRGRILRYELSNRVLDPQTAMRRARPTHFTPRRRR